MRAVEAVHELSNSSGAGAEGVFGQKRAGEGSFDPVLRLVSRSASKEKESLLVGCRVAPVRLRDVRANRVGRTNDLNSDSPFIERRPLLHCFAEVIGESDRPLISVEVLVAPHSRSSDGNVRLSPRVASAECRVPEEVGSS
jgi:hypothetical protein